MKIGELAERTDLNPSRIRFYESIGLLKMVERQANGYRRYPPEAVLVLNLITTAQKAGFSLDELRTLLPQDLSQWQHGTLIDTLQGKVREIEALERQLGESKRHLLSLSCRSNASISRTLPCRVSSSVPCCHWDRS